jgi:aspartyl protease family protein
MADAQVGHLINLILALALVISGALGMRHYSGSKLLRDAALWLAIVGVLAIGYAFRGELGLVKDRVLSELRPGRASVEGRYVRIAKDVDGHFRIKGALNGSPVTFLVDTGATEVVLDQPTARRIGLSLKPEDFYGRALTANGAIAVAPVRLKEVAIGPLRLTDVEASVSAAALPEVLLGMSALRKLSGYRVADNALYLDAGPL